jgi:hypothetical protein
MAGTAATSPDGITWTEHYNALPGSNMAWISVAYGGGRFVAIAKDCYFAASSPDGVAWTTRDLPLSDN